MGSVELGIASVLSADDALPLIGVTDLTVVPDGGVALLYTVSAAGGVLAYRITDSGLVLVDEASLPGTDSAGIAPELNAMTQGGAVTLLATGAGGLWALDGTDGSLSAAVAVAGGLPGDLAECTTVQRGGDTYLIGTRLGSEVPGMWRMQADGSFDEVRTPGAGLAHGAGITALRGLDLHGKAFVVAAAGDSNALVLYKVESAALVRKAVLGAESGLGIATPTCLALAEAGGVTHVLMGAAGSNSLSVAIADANGSLTLTDHVIDGLDTRLQGVTALETAVVNGRTYVVAAGSDDGVSLFELLPGGTLLHHAALADSTATTLDNVSAIALNVTGDTLQIMVTSASEPGLTLLGVEMPASDALITGGPGSEALQGGAGNDVLVDGAGSDTLTGGEGADTFVLTADGAVDVITDFEPGIDSLDLSAWAFLRSAGQLTIVERPDGAEIWFADERLVIQTASGKTLTQGEVSAMDLLSVDRLLPAWSEALVDPAPVTIDPDDTGMGSSRADFHDCGSGNSFFSGKAGEDTIRGHDGDDTLFGDAHSDYLDGGDGNDSLNGGQGADTLMGGNGNDFLEGKEGHDWLEGGPGNDTLSGDSDRDTLMGGSGDDYMKGGKGYDILYGDAGNDTLLGGEGHDELYGGEGHDWLEGGVSNDTMDGGAGNDVLLGNQGSDLMFGGNGNDSLRGHGGHDTLYGGAGNDSLYGSAGRDVLDGGPGDDLLSGGQGADVFIFNGGADTITDFDSVDTLKIDRAVWAGSKAALLDTASETDAGLMLDMGMGDTLLFKGVTAIDMVDDALSLI